MSDPVNINVFINELFGMSRSQVKNMAVKYKLKKNIEYVRTMLRKDLWNIEDIHNLIFLYPNHTNREIAKRLKRSIPMIKNKAHELKLRKSDSHILKASGRFPKGHIPWIQGKKGIHCSPETEFKKGMKPWNIKYNGCITTRFDIRSSRPYKWIRIECGQWIHLHKFIYENAYGPIIPGNVVIFKDKNTMNLNPDNLLSMTKADLLMRNRSERPKERHKVYAYMLERFKSLREAALIYRHPKSEEKLSKLPPFINQAPEQIKEKKKKAAVNKSKRIKIYKPESTFIKIKGYQSNLMDTGEKFINLAYKYMGDLDQAKDAIMNAVCFFIEGRTQPTDEDFKSRVLYECKLLKKDSYKLISYDDVTWLKEVI